MLENLYRVTDEVYLRTPCYALASGTRVAYVGSLTEYHGLATVVRTYIGATNTTCYSLMTDDGVPLNVNVTSVRILTEVPA